MTRSHAELAEALAQRTEDEAPHETTVRQAAMDTLNKGLDQMLAHRAQDLALAVQPGDEPLLPENGVIDDHWLSNASNDQLEELASRIIDASKDAAVAASTPSTALTTVPGEVTTVPSWSKGSAGGTSSYAAWKNYKRVVDYPAIPEAEGWEIPKGPVTKLAGIPLLIEMLTWRRPSLYGNIGISESEVAYRERYIKTLPGIQEDAYGNLWVEVGDDAARVLWSSHTDTVHREPGRQKVYIKGDFVELHKKAKKSSDCLGADDTVGNWIMREMILAEVPGLYVFHYGEESGGHGSSDLAKYNPKFLAGIDMAIAFDRMRYGSVITHQWGGRCCSDAFARSLARQLPGFGLDDGGSFTDTANYMDIVPECTNLSVGYFDQHSDDERLNLRYAAMMRDAMLKLDTLKLVIQRVPGELDPDDYWQGHGSSRYYINDTKASNYSSGGKVVKAWEDFDDQDDEPPVADIETIVKNYPSGVASILEEYGFDAKTLWDHLCEMYGFKSRHG